MEIENRGNVRDVDNQSEKPSIYLIDLKERTSRKIKGKKKNSKKKGF